MTLLEVVIAMAALASLSTLVAALWSQTRDWTAENASHHRLLSSERALSLLSEQWETRVVTLSQGPDERPAVRLDGNELQFVTMTPILNRDIPMALVKYRIERTGGAVVGERAHWRLDYFESPVINPASALSGASGSRLHTERRLTLIDNADGMRWVSWIDERGEEAVAPTAARHGWYGIREPLEVAAARPASANEDMTLDEAAKRAAKQAEKPQLRAGRLVGVLNGEEFAWQFIAAPSR